MAGKTALVGPRGLGRVGPGKQVLVNGTPGRVGTFAVRIIDRVHPLAEVPDAIRYVEDEHARAKAVISVTG